MTERLQKRLARAGVASRRAAEELITRGRVTVNGVVAQLGQSVTEADEIRVDGELVASPSAQHVTYAIYKPRGYVTSAHDELGRYTVIDAMPKVPGLHTVGRLDMDSEGLLILTTDGQLTLTLTHPRYGHEKVYRAWTEGGEPDEAAVQRLARGINLEDGPTGPAEVSAAPGGAWVTIREGRNRQVRRMLDAVGHPVTRLVRTRVGGLWLGELTPGEYRELDSRDLHDLLNAHLVPYRIRDRNDTLMRDRWE